MTEAPPRIKSSSSISLSPEQKRVVSLRGKNLQVIACAGSGKTESIARRVAALILEGGSPSSIIAFTFTEKAAAELKDRIYRRVQESQGIERLGLLAPMFIGTIHSYCFRLLQTNVLKYGNYDVLDEHRHIGLISREYDSLGLAKLSHKYRWNNIADFVRAVDIIGNELIDPADIDKEELVKCYNAYVKMLDEYRLLTFNLIISKAVEALEDPDVYTRVHDPLQHLIVDEYQDINPAQERLIQLLSRPPVYVCVVGDDDQSIYQWRGSDVENIRTFADRRKAVTVRLEYNRRSRPQIVSTANSFANSIPKRLPKAMKPVRPPSGNEVILWSAATPEDEARIIAETIGRLHNLGYRYQDFAVLFRSVRTSARPLVAALEEKQIPFTCGGRTGLFMQPEINLFGEIFAWIVDADWQDERYGDRRKADLDHIVSGLSRYFDPGTEMPGLRKYLQDWKKQRRLGNRPVNLVGDFYKLINRLGAHKIDENTAVGAARLGSFARFSELLADFEHVTRRGRPDPEAGRRKYKAGLDRGVKYFQRLYYYLLYYARDAYEDFEGEPAELSDAVEILTVHQAKGLEWPVVFVPALKSGRFPASRAGREQEWLLPESVFPKRLRERYQGGDPEERRLFYVAFTRARDVVYLSYMERTAKQAAKPSPYLCEVAKLNDGIHSYQKLPLPKAPEIILDPDLPPLEINFSDLATYESCAFLYRLACSFGFQQQIAVELGYGRAIHHVLHNIAESARRNRRLPSDKQIQKMLDEEFYLPFADRPAFNRMYAAASRLVDRYMERYRDDLKRVWETERPFQIYFPEGTISGRADIILDQEEGRPGRLAIVDYKTAKKDEDDERFHFQISVYAAAARSEGLDVTAGYVHELQQGERESVNVSIEANVQCVARVAKAMSGIRNGSFAPQAAGHKCEKCDYRLVCRHNSAKNIEEF
jgi:DNA helicase-2/ATP-dependent DNA helicase PcrA